MNRQVWQFRCVSTRFLGCAVMRTRVRKERQEAAEAEEEGDY